MAPHRLRLMLGDLPPSKIMDEVTRLARATAPEVDVERLKQCQRDAARLFRGHYEGYRASTNAYHDLTHTMQVVLAMARLLHGRAVAGDPASARGVELGLIAAIFHDIGFIQTTDDTEGTGAKYIVTHEDRGIEFVRDYFKKNGFPHGDFRLVGGMLRSTCLQLSFDEIHFASNEGRGLAQFLGTADLLGQMGDPRYLEKLPHLYLEFKEADIGGYRNELDLLDRTTGFWGYIQTRFDGPLGGVYRYARDHFRERFGIDRNIYIAIIEHQMNYLATVLREHRDDYREFLSSDHVIDKLAEIAVQDEK